MNDTNRINQVRREHTKNIDAWRERSGCPCADDGTLLHMVVKCTHGTIAG